MTQRADQIASLFSTIDDVVVRVLADGTIDDESRTRLGGLHQMLSAGAAALTPQADATPEESQLMHHVAAVHAIYFELPPHCRYAVSFSGVTWLHELDALTDQQLAGLRRVGPVTITHVRRILDMYYWRGDTSHSRDLWRRLRDSLQRSAASDRFLQDDDRSRIAQGIDFADQVLAENGRPLADPVAARWAVI